MFNLFYACSSSDEINSPEETPNNVSDPDVISLYNTWVLVSYGNEADEVLKEAKGYYYLITFHPDGTFSGKAYGNEMGGEYKLNGKEIQISRADITQLDVEGSDPDRFFLEYWADVYTYTITDTELRLYYSKDQYFKFRIKNDQS
jgi:heat shock protein HslJ